MSPAERGAGGEDNGLQLLKLGEVDGTPQPTQRQPAHWWQWLRRLQPRRRPELPTLQRRLELHCEKLKPLAVLVYPQGPGSCDHNAVDRAVNLVTTLPFFPIAWHTYRERQTPEGKLFGASIAGVGLGSLAFHSTSGDWRPLARRLDYTAIALSSLALVRSVLPGTSATAQRLALATAAFNPLAVSAGSAAAVEALLRAVVWACLTDGLPYSAPPRLWTGCHRAARRMGKDGQGHYLKRARSRPGLQRHHRLHAAACGLGAVCFAVEDLYPHWPVIHSVWHCLSAYSVASMNHLLADVEMERRASGGS